MTDFKGKEKCYQSCHWYLNYEVQLKNVFIICNPDKDSFTLSNQDMKLPKFSNKCNWNY